MINKTVWKKDLATFSVALLAVASFAAPVQAADSRTLNGVWQCHFRKTTNLFEKTYYSNWTFDAAKKWVVIFYSPVHKAFTYGYRWDGKRLVIGDPSKPLGQIYITLKTQIQPSGTLVIDDPRLRWQGWRCQRASSEQWPADGLQFLDYTRYPWLSSLIEDGGSIMKYRDPEQYQEFMEGRRQGLRGAR